MITGRQIRAARALLKWSAAVLAEKAGLTRETINKIEDDAVQAREGTLADIMRVFDENGIAFIEKDGVRLKPQNVQMFEGTTGFERFYDFQYEKVRKYGGNICVGGVDERLFAKYMPFCDVHVARMTNLVAQRDDISMHILVEEGDYNFIASGYAQYRWQPREYFSPTPFYVFGDCLALISFVYEPAPLTIVIQSAVLADAYRKSFNLAWAHAIDPPAQQ